MRELEKPIGRAWRRLRFQRFLSALVWCWGASLLAVAIAIAVEKLAHKPIPGADWIPFAIAGGVGLLAAALIAAFTGASRVDAAVAIDHRFSLNERLSTALTLPDVLRATPAGEALLADALKHVTQLDIPAQFGLKLPRLAWVPLLPAALAVGLLFVPEWVQKRAQATTKQSQALDKEVAAKQLKALAKSINAQRKEPEKNALSAETEKLMAEIEKVAEKLSKSPPAEKDKAMVELNKLSDALKDRQKQLGGHEAIARQLQQLKMQSTEGPAEEFAKDLAKGDFAKAAQELKQLQEKLMSGKMTEKEKTKLREQVMEMKEKLQQMANMEKKKQELEKALQQGKISKEQFDQQMAKMQDQQKEMQKLTQLAKQLAQAENALAQGDAKKAAQALGMSEQQLAEMAKNAQEIESLDEALADLQETKNGLANNGMNQLGSQLDGMNGLGMGNRPGNGGQGLGRGRGQGDRPEAEDNTALYNTKTKGQTGKGKAILEGFAPPSKQTKGVVTITDQAVIEAETAASAEAINSQKIPANVKKHVLNYFDQVRKGQ